MNSLKVRGMEIIEKWSEIAFGGLPGGIFCFSPFGFAMVILEYLISFLLASFGLFKSISEIVLRY